MTNPSAARRCAIHNLATGPGGRCTLCHRPAGQAFVAAAEPQSGVDLVTWLFGTGLIASLALLAWMGLAHQPAAPTQRAQTVVSPPAPSQPAAKPEPLKAATTEPPKSAALDPLDQPGEDTATAPERPAASATPAISAAELARREREREEQDRKRHVAVEHDLKQQSLNAARRNVTITMYSTTWCGVCSKARAYMLSKNIPFTELDVESDAAAHARAKELNPRGSVPTIAIDDELLIGFGAEALETRIDRAARKRAGS
jgi:glutaredoxin